MRIPRRQHKTRQRQSSRGRSAEQLQPRNMRLHQDIVRIETPARQVVHRGKRGDQGVGKRHGHAGAAKAAEIQPQRIPCGIGDGKRRELVEKR